MVKRWNISSDIFIVYEKSGWFSNYEASKKYTQRSTIKAITKEQAEAYFRMRVKTKRGIIQSIKILSCEESIEPDTYVIAVTGRVKFDPVSSSNNTDKERIQEVTIQYEYPKIGDAVEKALKNYAELNYRLDVQKYPGFRSTECVFSTSIVDDVDTFIII